MAKKAKAKVATASKAKTKAKARATGTRKEWTKEDLRTLKAHSKSRTPVGEIATTMERTEGSLRQKALGLGIRLGHRR
jgi:hypothetical protein